MPAAYGSAFLGREAEMGILSAELAGALAGDGRLVILAGEPGIGKTRLATALAAEARERGATVAWGRCEEAAGAPVYRPWVQALSACLAEPAAAQAPALREVLEDLRARGAAALPEPADEHARFELFDRIGSALAAAARARPLVVALDDLHWADAGSLRLLESVARRLGSIPLLVLGTVRDVEIGQRPEVAALLSAVVRKARSLPLAGLPRSAVQELLGERLGRPPAGALVDEVHDLTDGNPFFVIEVAHLLTASAGHEPGGARRAPGVPLGVRELFRQRLAPLPPASRRLLEVAAVLGREFDLRPLVRACGVTPEAALDALAPALELGLVREERGAAGRYAFAHALLRESLYAGLAPGARAASHRSVGEALEALGGPEEVRVPALAHHFFEAARAGDPAKAVRYACDAGEIALRLLAFEEATGHFERALAVVAPDGHQAERLRALLGLGEASHGAGDLARSEACLRDAVGVSRRLGPHAFADAALHFANVRADTAALDIEMNALLEEAISGLADERSPLRARLLARLARGLHLQPGAEARRQALAEEATGLARSLAEPATLAYVLTRCLTRLLGPDHLDERLAATEELLSARSQSSTIELQALVFRIGDLAELGDRAGLDRALTAFEQVLAGFRHPFFVWTAATFRAALALLEGRFSEAEARAAEALALGRQVHSLSAVRYYGLLLFTLRRWQGRLAEVEPFIEGTAREAGLPVWRCGLADFYSIVGREAEARREFEALASDDFAVLPRDSTWPTAVSAVAGVCGRLRDTRRAGILYDLIRPFAHRVALGRPLSVLVGPLEQRLGVLAGLLGRYEAAERHFAGALATAERMRGLPWQADIRRDWAEMLQRRGAPGDDERAETLLREAETVAEQLGMTLLLRWIEETRAARPAPRPARAGGRAPEALETSRGGSFRRDGAIWTLVFEGRTTRVRDMLGMRHLARLLADPGREVHVTDLVASVNGQTRDAGAHEGPSGDAGELLDGRAQADYEGRLRDLREELAEAVQLNDRGRAERLTDEVEFLAAELSRAFGLGGRPRRAGATSERARIAVHRAIKYSIDKIAEHDRDLAEHLRHAVRTGTFCVYASHPRDRVLWTL